MLATALVSGLSSRFIECRQGVPRPGFGQAGVPWPPGLPESGLGRKFFLTKEGMPCRYNSAIFRCQPMAAQRQNRP